MFNLRSLSFALLASAAFATVLAITAKAADVSDRVYYKPAPISNPATDWTGVYTGAFGTCGLGNDWSQSGFPGNTHGCGGGVHVGFDYQGRNFPVVVGPYADVAYLNVMGKNSQSFPGFSFSETQSLGLTASAGARLGFAVTPAFLVYGKAGVAATKAEDVFSYSFGGSPSTSHNISVVPGITWGAGAEWRFWQNLSVSGEWRHYDFSQYQKREVDLGLAGINFRF